MGRNRASIGFNRVKNGVVSLRIRWCFFPLKHGFLGGKEADNYDMFVSQN